MENNLTFSAALVRLKKQDQIARAVWAEEESLSLVDNEILIGKDSYVPIQEDILAEDWKVTAEAE